MAVTKKKIIKHLKGDIKGYKEEAQEDRELIKELKGHKMKKCPHCKQKMVTIAKGVKVKRGDESKMKKKPGGSNVGKYKNVKKGDFAGTAGGAPKGSYPVNTLKRAKAALAYAHNAPNPEGIKAKVYKKYPALKKRKLKREGK